ncbi:hypothetical protein A5678_04535 [Mycobacterium sp. E2733]|nr:hypothetical protein A5678_04535 [Mycobacterium sp. E2733]
MSSPRFCSLHSGWHGSKRFAWISAYRLKQIRTQRSRNYELSLMVMIVQQIDPSMVICVKVGY